MAANNRHIVERLMLQLLLISSIIKANASFSTASTALLNFSVELSSPAPFSTAAPLVTSDGIIMLDSGVSDAEEADMATESMYTGVNSANNDTAAVVGSTSVEQHDQPLPVVPPTTLSFSNVADANDTTTTQTHAVPPFAAVDDKYVPSKPQNLTVLDVSSNSITMCWYPPKNQNGAIAGYHVFHIHENQTGVEIVKNSRTSAESLITFVLPKLKPFTEYRVIVKAYTMKNEGEPSDQIVQRTDVAGPSAPIVENITCHSQDSIFIRWKRPYEFYNTIDFYVVRAHIQGSDTHRDLRINSSTKELGAAMNIPNLTTNSVYEVKVAAATYSIINLKKIVLGKFSEPRQILLQPNCEKIQPLLRQSHNDYNLAVLVGIIFSCFGIVLIVMAFFLWSRKCFHAAYYYLDDPPHHPSGPPVDWEVPIEVAGEIRAAVPVGEFAKHVASLHADGDIGFSREYEAIQNECVSDDLPCEHSQHPENKRKNRYLNITAYDHSRVHLHPTPGQKKNLDYINANFIDGYQKSRAFIGTQGPLPDTFDCFWRMIWEQRVAIIVMITNLVERGRRKCDMYWPKEGTDTYGVIQVKLLEEEVMSTYTVRTLQIKHLKLKKKKQANSEKIVYQYHYTNWPDHGTPDHPLPVLNFVKKSSAANPQDAGPIVVHCSAGVGRTGTYIVLDAMLKQIQQKGVVNVFGFLRHIRIQRNFLVQTEEQYIFIHDALVEAIASGETNLRLEQIEELKNCTSYLEQQYKNIIQFQTKDIHIASAMKQVNSIKNRGAIFPIEGSRVHLTPKPGEEGSDFINASWLHGFRRLRDFIVTQHPMAHTLKDFWQMVWDHNAQTIVLLSSLDEINFAQFWPDDTTPIESDYYRVKFLSKTNKNDYVSRDFVIQSIQDDYELNVKMLHCPTWPEMSNPQSIFDFIVDVHERCQDYRNGPIVVVDRYGGAQACTFCAISSLSIEMEYCNTANIYQYAKLYHNKRPGVWTSSEDIRLIYNILSYIPRNLQMLKRTALRTEFEDVTTATPDLYSKICSNGNVTNVSQINHHSSHNPNIITTIITNNTNNTNTKNIITSMSHSNSNLALNSSSRNSSSSSTQSTVQLYNNATIPTSTTTTTTPTLTLTSQQQPQQQYDDAHHMTRNTPSPSSSSSQQTYNNMTTTNTNQNVPSMLTNNNIHYATNTNPPMRMINDTNSNINFTNTNNAATSNIITPTSSTAIINNGMMMSEQQHQQQQWQSQQINYNDIDNDALPTNVGHLYIPPPPPEFNTSQSDTSVITTTTTMAMPTGTGTTTTATTTNENQLVDSLVTPPTTPTYMLNGGLDPMGLNPLMGGGGGGVNNSSSPTSSALHGNGLLHAINNHLQQHHHLHHLQHNNHQNNNNINNHNNSTNNTTNNNHCLNTAVTDAQSLDIVG